MAKNDQQEAYERLLSTNLARVIDFLKFAEAKNAALLTFSSAWILALEAQQKTHTNAGSLSEFSIHSSEVLFCLSALISLLSFLPRRRLIRFHQDPEQTKSLVYFGDISTFDPATFVARARERYFPAANQSANDRYLDDLAVQIAVNSKIANRKFTFFHVGALFVFVAFLALASPTILDSIRWLAQRIT